MLLTDRQTVELRKAILQYLQPKLEEEPAMQAQIYRLLELDEHSLDGIAPNYLEKKWLTVLRLQKRILDLENELSVLKQALDTANETHTGTPFLLPKDKFNWLPSHPKKTFRTSSSQVVNSVAFHPVLPLVTAGCSDGSLIMWTLVNDELVPQKLVANAHMRGVTRLRWLTAAVLLNPKLASEKTHLLASCSSDLLIKIWLGDLLVHLRTLSGHEHTVSSVAFSPADNNILYSALRDKAVKIWDIAQGICLRTFVGHSEWVRDVDVASINAHLSVGVLRLLADFCGDFLLTCSNDQSARLSHADSGTGLALLLGHSHVVECARFLPLLSNQYLDKLLAENKDQFPLVPEAVVSNDSYESVFGFKYCVTAGRDNVVKLWLLPPPQTRPNLPPRPSPYNNSQAWHLADLIGHQLWVKLLEVHPNGRFLLSAGDDKLVRIWDLATLQNGRFPCVRLLSAHDGFVTCASFAGFEVNLAKRTRESVEGYIQDNMRCLFVTGSTDNSVKLWA